MLISVEETEFCKINVHYEADFDTVASKHAEILEKFKDATVPGFRPKRATQEAIKIYFKKEINDALKRELANNAFQDTIFEKKLQPFGQPNFSTLSLDGLKFSCDFSLHIQPEFELKEYKGFQIPKPAQEMNADELAQKIVQDLRVRHGKTTPYVDGQFVQNSDNIVVNYSGSVDGQPVERLAANGELVIVGKTPIPGFDDNLLGMVVGDERKFTIEMPETIKDSLAGKSIEFTVKLVLGSKIEPAPLDDELAKKVGTFDNFQSMMNHAHSVASTRIAELEKAGVIDQISRRIITNHDFKVPNWISLAEAQMNAKNNGENWDVISDVHKEKYLEHSDNSVKLSLILNKIRDNEPDAQLSDEEVFKAAKDNITKFSTDPEQVLENLYKNGHLPILLNRIRDEYTLAFIEKTCTIIE